MVMHDERALIMERFAYQLVHWNYKCGTNALIDSKETRADGPKALRQLDS